MFEVSISLPPPSDVTFTLLYSACELGSMFSSSANDVGNSHTPSTNLRVSEVFLASAVSSFFTAAFSIPKRSRAQKQYLKNGQTVKNEKVAIIVGTF